MQREFRVSGKRLSRCDTKEGTCEVGVSFHGAWDLIVCKALSWVPKLKIHQTGVTARADAHMAGEQGPGGRVTGEQMRLVCEEHYRDEDGTVGRRGDGQVKGEEGKFVPANGVRG